MKVDEIRDLNSEEMHQKLGELKEELFNLRFQHGAGQLENTNSLKRVRKDLARIKTIIKEVEIKT